MMFHLHEKCKISTRRQIHFLKWLNQVVLKELLWPRLELWRVWNVVSAPNSNRCWEWCWSGEQSLPDRKELRPWDDPPGTNCSCFPLSPLWVWLPPGPLHLLLPFSSLDQNRENAHSTLELLKGFHLKTPPTWVSAAIQPQASPSLVTGEFWPLISSPPTWLSHIFCFLVRQNLALTLPPGVVQSPVCTQVKVNVIIYLHFALFSTFRGNILDSLIFGSKAADDNCICKILHVCALRSCYTWQTGYPFGHRE